MKIVADEWCNTVEDVRDFIAADACHMVQIKTPVLGGIQETVESVLYCKAHGMEAYQGGTCNETDVSAQCCVHLAMATHPKQMLAKPGMGFDEGFHDGEERDAADSSSVYGRRQMKQCTNRRMTNDQRPNDFKFE